MNHPPLTPLVMLQQLVRLNDTWPRWEADDAQFERMSRSFHESLSDLDAEAVAGGVGIWIRTSTNNRWPSPAQVRECAVRWILANRDTKVRWKPEEGACPTCGAKPRWAELSTTDWRTGKQGVVERMIHPCDASRHPNGSPHVPFPPNFIRWAPPPEVFDGTVSLKALVAALEARGTVPASANRPAQQHPGVARQARGDVPVPRGEVGNHAPAGARHLPLPGPDPITDED